MDLKPQLQNYLKAEGYDLLPNGTLSLTDFHELAARFQSNQLVLPEDLLLTELVDILLDENYLRFCNKYQVNVDQFWQNQSSIYRSKGVGSAQTDLMSAQHLIDLLDNYKIEQVAQSIVSEGDVDWFLREIYLLSKNNFDVAKDLFVIVANLDDIFAAEILTALFANSTKRNLCGDLMQGARIASEELFYKLVDNANAFVANQGFELIRLANESVARNVAEKYKSGIQRVHTIYGNNKALGEELVGSDGFYSAAAVHSYLISGYENDTQNEKIMEVSELLGRELASSPLSNKEPFVWAGIFINQMMSLSVDEAAGIVAAIYILDNHTGIKLLENVIVYSVNTKLLAAYGNNMEQILGSERFQTLYESLSRQSQGILCPQANTTPGTSDHVKATQIAMNQAGLVQYSGADFSITTGQVQQKFIELENFIKSIPTEVRNQLHDNEVKLRSLYHAMINEDPQDIESNTLKERQEEIAKLVLSFQIESVLGQADQNTNLVKSFLTADGLHENARLNIKRLLNEMNDTYNLLLQARTWCLSGDHKKARVILDYGVSRLMLIQQAMEIEEALNIARDSGPFELGYQNGNKAERDTLARLEFAKDKNDASRSLLRDALNGNDTSEFQMSLKNSLAESQRAYDNSIGKIRPTLDGTIRDAGWYYMMQDQANSDALVLGCKFTASTAIMVGLFMLAGPLGEYVGASFGGTLFGVGTTGATLTTAIVGLGIESAIFLAGEKTIHAAGVFTEDLAYGKSIDAAADHAASTMVYHSLDALGWDYAHTLVNLGILKSFTHGTQYLIQAGRVSNESLTYGIGLLAEMTGMGCGQTGVEALQYTFGNEPVYIIKDGVPFEVQSLADIFNGDQIAGNIGGSFETVLTYRIAGAVMRTGTEPVSNAIQNWKAKNLLKTIESQTQVLRQRMLETPDLKEMSRLLEEIISRQKNAYPQIIALLSKRPADAIDCNMIERQYLKTLALDYAYKNRILIANYMQKTIRSLDKPPLNNKKLKMTSDGYYDLEEIVSLISAGRLNADRNSPITNIDTAQYEKDFINGNDAQNYVHALQEHIIIQLNSVANEINQTSDPNRGVVELASNALDSGGSHPVEIHVRNDGFTVVDQGSGMNASGLMRLLLPKITSKEAAPQNDGSKPIGRFGIGFYTALRYLKSSGDSLTVETRQADSLAYRLTFKMVNGRIVVQSKVMPRQDSSQIFGENKTGTRVTVKCLQFSSTETLREIDDYLRFVSPENLTIVSDAYVRNNPALKSLHHSNIGTESATIEINSNGPQGRVVLRAGPVVIEQYTQIGNVPDGEIVISLPVSSKVSLTRDKVAVTPELHIWLTSYIEQATDIQILNVLVPLIRALDLRLASNFLLPKLNARAKNLLLAQSNILVYPDIPALQSVIVSKANTVFVAAELYGQEYANKFESPSQSHF